MRVLEIWRYPVKSMQGERLDAVEVTATGLVGDRRFALFDGESGLGLTARRHPELLHAYGRLGPDGGAEIRLPDGTPSRDDADLSSWLGRRVQLRAADSPADARDDRRFENPSDFEDEAAPWDVFHGGRDAFHDMDGGAVSLVSTGSLRGWDRRRFRSNLLLDGVGEDDLVGDTVRVGGAVLRVFAPITRCVMTTREQPDDISRDLDVLRTIHRDRGGRLAVAAAVTHGGQISVTDELTLG
ncbi:MAG: MOSC N-terminal beta barrel domain-containing protein [Actinomycetota bacterium]|nr:MOSC N-terminal beta barrel domain-containing protein [Actinomycetota bacterium]